jgi:hypothetical protein
MPLWCCGFSGGGQPGSTARAALLTGQAKCAVAVNDASAAFGHHAAGRAGVISATPDSSKSAELLYEPSELALAR